MLDHLATEREGATALIAVEPDSFEAWLEQHPDQRPWLHSCGFTAAPGTFALLPVQDGAAKAVVAPFKTERLWRFAGFPIALPAGRYAFADEMSAKDQTEAALGWALGSYQFSRYKSPTRAPAVLVWPHSADRDEVERLARAIGLARDLINTPADDMGPEALAAAAAGVAAAHGAHISIIAGDDLLEQNYPCVHAVGRASSRPPRLVDFRWGEETAPKVTLVGKGVCFDSGGLDIKTHEGMLEMKKDMGGAAVVLGLADALMAAQLPIRLRVLIPAVENSISANAMRPLDIVRTRSGKTVEIGNTDAEGRLILCDALFEADGEEPQLLIDCATLTGAAKIALGPEVQALFCDDEEAAAELVGTSLEIGDPVWRLPIWRSYRPQLDGRSAELTNWPKSQLGGAVTAALYLSEFVRNSRVWMHLDIMAANQTPRPGRPEGGEATGLLALYHFIRNRYAR